MWFGILSSIAASAVSIAILLGRNPDERTGKWGEERLDGRFVGALDEVSDRIGSVLELFVTSRGKTCDNDGYSRCNALGQAEPRHRPSWGARARPFDGPAEGNHQQLEFVLGYRFDERIKRFACRGMNADGEIVKQTRGSVVAPNPRGTETNLALTPRR